MKDQETKQSMDTQSPKEEQPQQEPRKQESEAVRKLVYALCYLFGILFFLPLVMYKDDAEAKCHANEGLVLLIFSIAGNALFSILTVFGGVMDVIFSIVSSVYSLALLILGIIGIVYAVTDAHKPLPILGGIKILK